MNKSLKKSLLGRLGCHLNYHEWVIIDETESRDVPYSRECKHCGKKEVIHKGIIMVVDEGELAA